MPDPGDTKAGDKGTGTKSNPNSGSSSSTSSGTSRSGAAGMNSGSSSGTKSSSSGSSGGKTSNNNSGSGGAGTSRSGAAGMNAGSNGNQGSGRGGNYNSGTSGSKGGGASTQSPGAGGNAGRVGGSSNGSGGPPNSLSGIGSPNSGGYSAPPGSGGGSRGNTGNYPSRGSTEHVNYTRDKVAVALADAGLGPKVDRPAATASDLARQYSQYRSPPSAGQMASPRAPDGLYGPRAGVGTGYLNDLSGIGNAPSLSLPGGLLGNLPSSSGPRQPSKASDLFGGKMQDQVPATKYDSPIGPSQPANAEIAKILADNAEMERIAAMPDEAFGLPGLSRNEYERSTSTAAPAGYGFGDFDPGRQQTAIDRGLIGSINASVNAEPAPKSFDKYGALRAYEGPFGPEMHSTLGSEIERMYNDPFADSGIAAPPSLPTPKIGIDSNKYSRPIGPGLKEYIADESPITTRPGETIVGRVAPETPLRSAAGTYTSPYDVPSTPRAAAGTYTSPYDVADRPRMAAGTYTSPYDVPDVTKLGDGRSVVGGMGISPYQADGQKYEYRAPKGPFGDTFNEFAGYGDRENVLQVENLPDDVPVLDVPGYPPPGPSDVSPSQAEPRVPKWQKSVLTNVPKLLNAVLPGVGTLASKGVSWDLGRIENMTPAEYAAYKARVDAQNQQYLSGQTPYNEFKDRTPMSAMEAATHSLLGTGGGSGGGGSSTGGSGTGTPGTGTGTGSPSDVNYGRRTRVGNPADLANYGYGPSYEYFTYSS